ncbi:MAG: copper chaperone PCu(A)C [Pseudomonadota bacterium]
MNRRSFFTLCAALCIAGIGLAEAQSAKVMVDDAYARVSRPGAPTGAAFMQLMNHGTEEDRLIAAASDVAERVEIHTHLMDANGVARMVEVEDGIAIPAGEAHALARGGDHVMFMGLNRTLETGDEISVTLTFEKAGEVVITIPVDNERTDAGVHSGHGHHGHDS